MASALHLLTSGPRFHSPRLRLRRIPDDGCRGGVVAVAAHRNRPRRGIPRGAAPRGVELAAELRSYVQFPFTGRVSADSPGPSFAMSRRGRGTMQPMCSLVTIDGCDAVCAFDCIVGACAPTALRARVAAFLTVIMCGHLNDTCSPRPALAAFFACLCRLRRAPSTMSCTATVGMPPRRRPTRLGRKCRRFGHDVHNRAVGGRHQGPGFVVAGGITSIVAGAGSRAWLTPAIADSSPGGPCCSVALVGRRPLLQSCPSRLAKGHRCDDLLSSVWAVVPAWDSEDIGGLVCEHAQGRCQRRPVRYGCWGSC